MVELLTKEDLENFKNELIEELRRSTFRHPRQDVQKKWLKSYEGRKLLGFSPNTLQALREKGKLPSNRVGGLIFYSYEDIRKLMDGG